ncbi:uncharacterized protein LOC123547923 [Mercenaria mercenaria]|uniref:uncharacterized protein LOC123547923 n=1 Tax=Mercenaria mercenaria TaxID=6596 RepID=UPI001E1D6BBD|nr:uncharacterized protein LOC123547923 [Mercenaria mercenaria]
MDYHPLRVDALGLSDMFKMDLMKQLDSIMEPPCDNISSHCDYDQMDTTGSLTVNINFNQEPDCYLETIRSDAFEDFSRNGIEQDLDEVDVFQSKLRERTTATTRPIEPETGYNPVAVDYMNQKRRKSKKKSKTICVFCKNNNEQPQIYQSHVLKDSEGRTTCPILRKYTCPICGVRGGDDAHTIRYCPRNLDRDLNPGLGLLMKSPRLSTGKVNPRCAN